MSTDPRESTQSPFCVEYPALTAISPYRRYNRNLRWLRFLSCQTTLIESRMTQEKLLNRERLSLRKHRDA